MPHPTWWPWGSSLGLVVGVAVGLAVAQAPTVPVGAPPPCERQLAQALQRSITLQTLATQEREALALYLQGQMEQVSQERDALKKQLDAAKNGQKD